MTNQDVNELAFSTGLFKEPKVRFLANGFGNANYQVKDGAKKFILRVKASTEESSKNSLASEFAFLKFAESKSLNFMPKAYYLAPDYSFMIEDFLPGRERKLKDLLPKKQKLFIRQLYAIHQLRVQEFIDFAKKHQLLIDRPLTADSSLQLYGFQRLEIARKSNISKDIIKWLEDKLLEFQKILHERASSGDNFISWGDVQGTVFTDAGGRVYLFDFEHISLENSTNDLAYLKIHGGLSAKQFLYAIKCYAELSGLTIDELIRDINTSRAYTMVNDVIWSAMEYANTGEESYLKMAKQRFSEVQTAFHELG